MAGWCLVFWLINIHTTRGTRFDLIAVIPLSLPTALPLVFLPLPDMSPGAVAEFLISIGLNAIAAGYASEWAWRNVPWRLGLRLMVDVLIFVLIIVLSILWLLWRYA
jgi:hypothetical protein